MGFVSSVILENALANTGEQQNLPAPISKSTLYQEHAAATWLPSIPQCSHYISSTVDLQYEYVFWFLITASQTQPHLNSQWYFIPSASPTRCSGIPGITSADSLPDGFKPHKSTLTSITYKINCEAVAKK